MWDYKYLLVLSRVKNVVKELKINIWSGIVAVIILYSIKNGIKLKEFLKEFLRLSCTQCESTHYYIVLYYILYYMKYTDGWSWPTCAGRRARQTLISSCIWEISMSRKIALFLKKIIKIYLLVNIVMLIFHIWSVPQKISVASFVVFTCVLSMIGILYFMLRKDKFVRVLGLRWQWEGLTAVLIVRRIRACYLLLGKTRLVHRIGLNSSDINCRKMTIFCFI